MRSSHSLQALLFVFVASSLFADPVSDALRLIQRHLPPLLIQKKVEHRENGVTVKAFFKTRGFLERVELQPLDGSDPVEMDIDVLEQGGKEVVFYRADLEEEKPFRLFAEDDQGDWLVQLPPQKDLDCEKTGGEVVARGVEQEDVPESVRIKEVRMAHDMHQVMLWFETIGEISPGYIVNLDQAFAQGYAVAFLQGFHAFAFVHAPLIEQMPFDELSKAPQTFFVTYKNKTFDFNGDFRFKIKENQICVKVPVAYLEAVNLPYFRLAGVTVAITSIVPFSARMAHRSNFSHVYFLNEKGEPFSFFKKAEGE